MGRRPILVSAGDQFGRLKVVGLFAKIEQSGKLRDFYKCRCSCGNTQIVQKSHLLQGSTMSCGCLQREILAELNARRWGIAIEQVAW